MGVFWYFITEMFQHFHGFFMIIFQMNVFLYTIPLTIRLRCVLEPYTPLCSSGMYICVIPLSFVLEPYIPLMWLGYVPEPYTAQFSVGALYAVIWLMYIPEPYTAQFNAVIEKC